MISYGGLYQVFCCEAWTIPEKRTAAYQIPFCSSAEIGVHVESVAATDTKHDAENVVRETSKIPLATVDKLLQVRKSMYCGSK